MSLLTTTKSLADDIKENKCYEKENITLTQDNKDEENFDISFNELEEIDNNEDPSYVSSIFFSMPFIFGFNYPIKNNENIHEGKNDFNFLGSRTIGGAVYVNFPFAGYFIAALGCEIEKSSLYWNGEKKLHDKLHFLSDDKNKKVLKEIHTDAIDHTKFYFWNLGLSAKLKMCTERFDPTDGFYAELQGGIGFKFFAALETELKSSFDGIEYTISGNDKLLGLNRLTTYVGLEFGYQRIGIFYRQFFNSIFDLEKVEDQKVCSFPMTLGINFNLI